MQDPREFFKSILADVESLDPTIYDGIRIQLEINRQCKSCGHKCTSSDTQYELMLQVQKSFKQSLHTFMKPNDMTFQCPQCSENVHEEDFKLNSLPPSILCLVDRREGLLSMAKTMTPCEIPVLVDFAQICSKLKIESL